MKKPLIFLALNEINFDLVGRYAMDLQLGNLQKVLSDGLIETASEDSYEMLEPWIHWVSVHTGMAATDHGVFRLGDIVNAGGLKQIFEVVEERGFKVGAVSPMNAENKLRNPDYFVADAWTQTSSGPGTFFQALAAAIAQAVGDNATGKISPSSLFIVLMSLIRYANPSNYLRYIQFALSSRKAPWRKALFLDLFLSDLHLKLMKKCKTDFSWLFLNAGAHIQHHYYFNAAAADGQIENPRWYVKPDVDPVAEMLKVYDHILAAHFARHAEIIVATGLTQKPYDRVKYYYRLKDHAHFLASAGIEFEVVEPRMTRDFLVRFHSQEAARIAEVALKKIEVLGAKKPLFGEVDNRGASLFVTLNYPDAINDDDEIALPAGKFKIKPMVAFVAIKNGMHDGKGYAYFSPGVAGLAPQDNQHVKGLYNVIDEYFAV